MKMYEGQPAGFALLLNARGEVQRVLRDYLDLASRMTEGMPFCDLVDVGSREKAGLFLKRFEVQRAVFGWELNVVVEQQLKLLHFAGVARPEGTLIVGAVTRGEVARLYEELAMRDAASASEMSDMLDQYRRDAEQRAELEERLYDEISRLNNELLNARRELARRNRELEQLNRQKNEFLGMAAHDLRTPLGIISTYAGFLLQDAGAALTDEQLEFLRIIRSSSQFMERLVNDLLDISAIESGKLTLDLQATDVVELARHNVRLNRMLAERKQIELILEAEEGLPLILADAGKLEQVLNNLISNAIKYSHPHTVVRVQLARRQNELHLAVVDQGQGIPAQELERLFRPFQRTSVKSTAGEKSTGLGLVIAKKVVEEHGGRIEVTSQVGQGSTFSVVLPLREVKGAAAGGATSQDMVERERVNGSAAGERAKAEPVGPPVRVLLADDNVLNQKMAQRILEKRGYVVRTAATGRAALEAVERERFDVVLMDVHMPEMDGLEATAEIRRREKGGGSHLLILAMTATLLDEDRAACAQAGMDAAISKPLQMQELEDVLKRFGVSAAGPQ